eukprot:2946849-Rhodomonas_salina.2
MLDQYWTSLSRRVGRYHATPAVTTGNRTATAESNGKKRRPGTVCTESGRKGLDFAAGSRESRRACPCRSTGGCPGARLRMSVPDFA